MPKKKIMFKDKEIEVSSIKAEAMMRLIGSGQSGNLGELMKASIRQEDLDYLNDLDYEVGLRSEFDKLTETWRELNPTFFQKPVQKEETKPNGI